jgi:alcohol dehydrogenase class IV
MARIARALGAKDAPTALYDLELQLGLKMRLADLGMKAADLDRAAELATQAPYPNPAPIEKGAVRALLEAAYAGRRPA